MHHDCQIIWWLCCCFLSLEKLDQNHMIVYLFSAGLLKALDFKTKWPLQGHIDDIYGLRCYIHTKMECYETGDDPSLPVLMKN